MQPAMDVNSDLGLRAIESGFFFFQAEDGIRDVAVTGVQTCALPISIDSATGALTSIGTIPTGSRPISVAVDPFRKFVYVVNVGSNDVSTYSVDTTTGTLTSTGTIAAGSGPASVAVDPSGKFAYVANGSDVAMYTISDTAGGLASIGTIAAGARSEERREGKEGRSRWSPYH